MAKSQEKTDRADETNKQESAEEEPKANMEQQGDDLKEKATLTDESEPDEHPVSGTIKKMTGPSAVAPDENVTSAEKEELPSDYSAALSKSAKDIMQKDIIWLSPEDNVQQALDKMQQGTGYMIVGKDGLPEGIVSKSDLAGAVSPYLRPEFAKWRRPLDDATLQIKVKWIMNKPVDTTQLETPLVEVMETMCRLGRRALPVVDNQGKVQGLITVFDIFRILIENFSCK